MDHKGKAIVSFRMLNPHLANELENEVNLFILITSLSTILFVASI